MLTSYAVPTLAEVETSLATDSLADFVQQAWPTLEPGTPYLDNWHIGAIAEYLSAVTAGDLTRLVINLPPRYMKSTIVTLCWPAWEWLTQPSRRWLFVSYSESLAVFHSVLRRQLMQSEWYRARWGDRFRFTGDQNVKGEYRNDRQGHMIATGIGGTLTGKGGTRIVVDDPHDPLRIESDLERLSAINFFDRKLFPRLDDKTHGAIVVVMQRTHEGDLAAHCQELGYTMLSLPMEAPHRTVITLPQSGGTITREPGDLLWPARDDAAAVAGIKRAMGSYAYAGQYGQAPAPPTGGIFPRHWWRFWCYPDAPLPPVPVLLPDGSVAAYPVKPIPAHRSETGAWVYDCEELSQSWDTGGAVDVKSTDYVVGQVWGKQFADRFLLAQHRDRLTLAETVTAVQDLTTLWPQATAKLIENKVNGPVVIRALQQKIAGLVPINPEGDKVARAQAVTPTVESHNVFLPHPQIAPWVDDFMNNCATFPYGRWKDEIDTMTQQLARWLTSGYSTLFPAWLQAQAAPKEALV